MQKTNSDGTIYAADKVGFGIYHFAQGGMDARRVADSETFALDGGDRAQCDRQEQLDYMNFYIYCRFVNDVLQKSENFAEG